MISMLSMQRSPDCLGVLLEGYPVETSTHALPVGRSDRRRTPRHAPEAVPRFDRPVCQKLQADGVWALIENWSTPLCTWNSHPRETKQDSAFKCCFKTPQLSGLRKPSWGQKTWEHRGSVSGLGHFPLPSTKAGKLVEMQTSAEQLHSLWRRTK